MPDQTWKDALNERQLEAVTYRPEPLLVLAGPGSGKTRVLAHRVAWLVEEKGAWPENILAVTFTNRAAEEMRDRLAVLLGESAQRVWVYTFHATAVRILRRFGAQIKLDPKFAIIDEDEQRHALNHILRQTNLSRELYPTSHISRLISQRKGELINPLGAQNGDDLAINELIQGYEDWLRQHNALDFDDLIRYAVLLLRSHEDVRQHFHRTLHHILVDEYQDINQAQYELLRLLAPLRGSLTIVADDDQTIYGWRGSKPELIDGFIRRYSPYIVRLDTSYRCPPNILYGARAVINYQRSPERQRYMRSVASGDAPIFHYLFHNLAQEQQWLVALIRRLIDERGYKPGDIAILYRTHRLANPIEQTLVEAGFRIHRVQKESFFDLPLTRDIVRYLQLLRALTEENFTTALNFPVRMIDELTMIQLRRLADANQTSLVDIARRAQDFPELSPLTRAHLARFLDVIEARLPDLFGDAESAMIQLFRVLEELRSPWSQADRQILEGFLNFADLSAEADLLADAFENERPIIVLHPPSLDGYAAAFLLADAFDRYLQTHITTQPVGGAEEVAEWPDAAILLAIGVADEHIPSASARQIVRLGDAGDAANPYALATYAWRCAQLLLIGYETLADGRFVIYDIETTGTNVQRDEVVEIAAGTYEEQQPVDEPFHRFVRPQRGYIPQAATNVHGIRFADVADAPMIAQVLPEFLDYLGNETVVGHNIARFDNRYIDRACGEFLNGRGFHPYYIDTLRLARRLVERSHHDLSSLLDEFHLDNEVAHRAGEDVNQTAKVFFALTERITLEKEMEALTEHLPLVAMGTLAAGVAMVEENQTLLDGAARLADASRGKALLDAFVEALPAALRSEAVTLRATVLTHQPPAAADDDWQAQRDEFLTHVQAFKRYGSDPSLAAFLDYQSLLNSIDTAAHTHSDDRLTLMTMHNAKGTEFPVVIIIGVEQENLPLWRTLDNPEMLAEERRVFYVGLTRARDSVYLFSVRDQHDGFLRNPSRFAFEIPPEYIRRYQVDSRNRIHELTRHRPETEQGG